MQQVKLIIERETKMNGDVYFCIYKNDAYVEGSSTYSGNYIQDSDFEKKEIAAYNKVLGEFENIKKVGKPKREVIKEEIIELD